MIENKARRNPFEEETYKINDQSSPKICYFQVVASKDRIPRNTETKRQINPGNLGEGPKSRKREEPNTCQFMTRLKKVFGAEEGDTST